MPFDLTLALLTRVGLSVSVSARADGEAALTAVEVATLSQSSTCGQWLSGPCQCLWLSAGSSQILVQTFQSIHQQEDSPTLKRLQDRLKTEMDHLTAMGSFQVVARVAAADLFRALPIF
jgi:hypothetical protein